MGLIQWRQAEEQLMGWVKKGNPEARWHLGILATHLGDERVREAALYILRHGITIPPPSLQDWWKELPDPVLPLEECVKVISQLATLRRVHQVYQTHVRPALEGKSSPDGIEEKIWQALQIRYPSFMSWPELVAKAQDKGQVIMPRCFPGIFKVVNGLRRGETHIVAGQTGIGKTTFAYQVAWDFLQQGMGVVIYSMDIPASSCVQVMREVSGGKISEQHRVFFKDEIVSADELMGDVWAWQANGIDLVIIDKLQQIRVRAQTLEERVSQASHLCLDLARRAEVVMLILSSVPRFITSPIQPGVVFGSNEAEADASCVIVLWPNKVSGISANIIKARFGKYPLPFQVSLIRASGRNLQECYDGPVAGD